MDPSSLSPEDRATLDGVAADLRRVFGARFHSFAAYGLHAPAPEPRVVHSVVLVERLAFEDLAACVPLAAGWRQRGVAVPLLLERQEFLRTLDVFPLEYGDIIADHVLLAGADAFREARVSPADVRRACELRAKSQLIHLREGFLESGGDPRAVARLIAASAGAFRALLANIARLADDPDHDLAASAERLVDIPAPLVREVLGAGSGHQDTIADPTALLARYITAVERIWEFLDTWRARGGN